MRLPFVHKKEVPTFWNKQANWLQRTVYILLIIFVIGLFGILFLFKSLGGLRSFVPYARNILGLDQEKTYLIILQNNYELRPTGGFISAYGILKIKNGWPQLTIQDSYALDKTDQLYPAPEALQYFLKSDPKFQGWYFRDGNFNPDFSQSSLALIRLYNQQAETGKTFDGVIAVNFSVLENLIDNLGEIRIGERVLNSANLFQILQTQVKNIDTHNVEDLAQRKNILGELGKILIKKIVFSPQLYGTISQTIQNALTEKNILLYFTNQELQKFVSDKNWGGRLNFSEQDNWVQINIANIGGRKADRYLEKNHEQIITFDNNGQIKVHHILTISHHGTYHLNSDRYQAYIRFLAPTFIKPDQVWGDFEGSPQKYDASHTRLFDGYVSLLPGERKILHFTYPLPDGINASNYKLHLVKQPGTADPWRITLRFPNDQNFTNSAQSAKLTVKDNIGYWDGILDQDTIIEPQLLPDKNPPLIVWQKFTDLQTIEVNFSEELDDEALFESDNYELKDLNYINQQTDQITVTKVVKNHNTLYLKVQGVTRAEEERYSLTIRNVHDHSWNFLDPDPMTVTVVQRL